MRFLANIALLICMCGLIVCPFAPKTTPKQATPTKKVTTEKPTEAAKIPEKGKDFSFTIRILSQEEFCPCYLQIQSKEFQEMREKIYDAMLALYGEDDMYQDTLVYSFENATGGMDANLIVRFTKEDVNHLDRLTEAVKSGKLGSLEIAPKFIKISELDQTILYPQCADSCPNSQACFPACDESCCQGGQEQTFYIPVNPPPAPPPPPPPPPTPPPPPPEMAQCAMGCPGSCAPACTPTCCFVQKRWLAKNKNAAQKLAAIAAPQVSKPVQG